MSTNDYHAKHSGGHVNINHDECTTHASVQTSCNIAGCCCCQRYCPCCGRPLGCQPYWHPYPWYGRPYWQIDPYTISGGTFNTGGDTTYGYKSNG